MLHPRKKGGKGGGKDRLIYQLLGRTLYLKNWTLLASSGGLKLSNGSN
jgi:hypothetical protein